MVGGSTLATEFVARERELSAVTSAWEAAGGLVVLRGVAGVGKSRLARELARHVARHGGRVLIGRCTASGRDVPLRPVAEALLGAARAGWAPPPSMAAFVPALARLVPGWGSSADADPSVLVLGEAVLRFAASLATPAAAALLVMEDVHWADGDSVGLLDYLADAVTSSPVLLLATCRSGVAGHGAGLVDRLEADRRASVLEVRPLELAGIEALARSCLGVDALPEGLVETLAARTDGVPFLVEELLVAAGSTSEATQILPASVMASVQARLAALSDDTVGLLRCAALLGRQFDWPVAAAAAGVGSVAADGALRSATEAQLLERDRGGFRFRHALTRDAVLADLLESEFPRLSRLVLDELERLDPGLVGDHLVTATELAVRAGDTHRAAVLSLRAARRALAAGSLDAAGTLAQQALDLAGGDSSEAALLLLSIWNQAGRLENVLELGGGLQRRVEGQARADAAAAVALALVQAGRWEEADAAIGAARAVSPEDPTRRARLDVLAAEVALGRGDADTAIAVARQASRADDAITRCEALLVVGRIERLRDPAAAEEAFAEAARGARDQGLRTLEIRALQELGTIDLYTTVSAGRLEQARRQAEEAGALSTVALVDLQLAALYCERMETDVGLAAARRSAEASQRFGLATLPMAIGMEATAHGKAGRRSELEAAAQRARATGRDQVDVELLLWGNAWASFHLHRGDRPAALAALDRSVAWMRRKPTSGHPFSGLWALLATTLEAPNAEAARTEVRAMPLDTPMSRAMLQVADAVVAGERGEGAQAERLFAAAEGVLARYEGAYRLQLIRWLASPPAHRAGWGQPETWLREAVAGFEQLGLDGLARSAREELRALGVPVPRMRAGSVVPPGLVGLGITGRELDVLVLLAEGLGNRDIAERLFLSQRTVEKHVERLKLKTGRNRAGLGALVERRCT